MTKPKQAPPQLPRAPDIALTIKGFRISMGVLSDDSLHIMVIPKGADEASAMSFTVPPENHKTPLDLPEPES